MKASHSQIHENDSTESKFAKHDFYGSIGPTFGNYLFGLNLDLKYVFADRLSARIGYHGIFRKPDDEPDDYIIGLFELFSFGYGRAYDEIHNFHLLAGGMINIKQSNQVRLHLRGGMAYSRRLEPTNWESQFTFLLTENYTYDLEKTEVPAIIINAELEYAFVSFMGLSIDVMAIFREDDFFAGAGITWSFGKLKSD